jgi:hypothetical protein
LVRYWAFNATNVLLFTAAQRLSEKSFAQVGSLLNSASVCISVLKACGVDEPVAIRFLDTVEPSYTSLRTLEQSILAQQSSRNRTASKMGIHNLLHDSPISPTDSERSLNWALEAAPTSNSLSAITARIVDILKDPYGRLQRVPRTPSSGSDPEEPGFDVQFWFT